MKTKSEDEVRKDRDTRLIQRSREGDTSAIDEIVANYHRSIYWFCLKILRYPSDAEDAVQETFLRLVQHIQKIKNPAHLRSWIYRVSLNVCRKKIRFDRIRRWISLSGDLEPDEEKVLIPDSAPDPEQTASGLRLAELLEKLSYSLPKALREAALLSFFHGLSETEVAEILGISLGNVRIRLHRARERLWEEYKKI